jgi:oxysterol-binding protein-related protein 8
MLERITDFMSHPDLIFGQVPFSLIITMFSQSFPYSRAENCNDPEERFMRVLSYYLAGWHIKPKGVKKPSVAPMFIGTAH